MITSRASFVTKCVYALIVMVTVSCIDLLRAQSVGIVAGSVLANDTQKPIANVTVLAIAASPSNTSAAPEIIRAETSAQGTFSFMGSIGKTYTLCIHNSGTYLNPCQWGTASQVTVGSETPAITIELVPGRQLSVRVLDPKGLIDGAQTAAGGGLFFAPMFVHVKNGQGADVAVPIRVSGGNLVEFSDVIPSENDWKVFVDSGVFQFINENGAAYSSGEPIDIPNALPSVSTARFPGMFSSTNSTVAKVVLTIN
jgi:hypothetical protein